MVKLYLRQTNGIQPPILVDTTQNIMCFNHPESYEGSPIKTRLQLTGNLLESSFCLEVEPAIAKVLPKKSSETLSKKNRETINQLFAPLCSANQRILSILCQELEQEELRRLTSGSRKWSVDGKIWTGVLQECILTGVTMRRSNTLDEEWKVHIQSILDLQEEPFLAFEHLHEALRGQVEKFKWIEATIAAELAIKEALSRMEPKLSSLLFEVPAPPLGKLYGPILEDVTGERSPYLKELNKGVEVRNKLVHRPEEIKLDLQKVVDYVSIVERAIWHLVGLCRGASTKNLHKISLLRSKPSLTTK